MPKVCNTAGKRPGARVGESTRALTSTARAPLSSSPNQVIAVGWTQVGDFCHVPVTVEGTLCTALVDTGSNATLVRPDMVPEGASMEATTVHLKTVTGDLAPMVGRCVLRFRVGAQTVLFAAWVADVQDKCILGLDFLRTVGCILDLGKGTLTLPGGKCVRLTSSSERVGPAVAVANPTDATAKLGNESPGEGGEEGRISAVRGIWAKNCEGLTQEQQDNLWEVLLEFKDIFALDESEVGLTHMVEHHIDTGGAHPVRVRPIRRRPTES